MKSKQWVTLVEWQEWNGIFNGQDAYFIQIDPVVTRDISRVIRLPGSLYIRRG